MTVAGVLLGLLVCAGCGKQEGALSPNQGSTTSTDQPTPKSRPTASAISGAGLGAIPSADGRYSGGEGALGLNERAVRRAGGPFFHGSWLTESGASGRGDRAARKRRSNAGSKSAAGEAEPDRHRGPAIRQILRSIKLSLNADGTIQLDANGGVQTGRYAVRTMDAQSAQITARFESGAVAATDVFTVRAMDRDGRGRARIQVTVSGSEPMTMVEQVTTAAR